MVSMNDKFIYKNIIKNIFVHKENNKKFVLPPLLKDIC